MPHGKRQSVIEKEINKMKKFYEAPKAEELYTDASALMNTPLASGSDKSEDDLDWDLL